MMDEQVPTWRQSGRFLTPAELDDLSEGQRVQYMRDSSVQDLSEIDEMPEPQRSIFKRLIARAQDRHQRRAS